MNPLSKFFWKIYKKISKNKFWDKGYLTIYPDIQNYSPEDSIRHYILHGKSEGRSNGLNPPEDTFFAEGYLLLYSDVAGAGLNPWKHYVMNGKSEGRSNGLNPPEDAFFADGYLLLYPDVAGTGLNPWKHYAMHGKSEGRSNGLNPPEDAFFADGYLLLYPDVAGAGLDPWKHYVTSGKSEGRSNGLNPPEEMFFPEGYLIQNQDVAKIGIDPWHYYVIHEKNKKNCGYDYPESFSPNDYLFLNPDIVQEGFSPWYHFVKYGKYRSSKIFNKDLFYKLYNNIYFSVIMPTYNRKNFISLAIDSLLNQSFQNFELIIGDDGSTDGTKDYIENRYRNEILQGKIRYIYLNHNGVCHTRNKCLEIAKNDWITYLDTDNQLRYYALELYAKSIANTNSNILYAKFMVMDSKYIIGHKYDFDILLNGNYIDLGTFVHHKKIYYKNGGFDEKIKRLNDWDLIINYCKDEEPYFIDAIVLNYYNKNNILRISNTENHGEFFNYIKSKYKK